MAKTTGTCGCCGRMNDRLNSWKGKRLCATCVNLASGIRNHRDTVDKLYTMIHGVELVAGANAETGNAELDYLYEVVASVNDALGGGHTAGDLAGAVRGLAQRAAVMTSAVQVAEDHGTECDPHNCDELRDALALILRIRHRLDNGGLDTIMLHAGRPHPDDIEALLAEMITELHDLDAERHNIDVRMIRLRAAIGMPDPQLSVEQSAYRLDVEAELDRMISHLEQREQPAADDHYLVAPGYESLMQVLVAAHDQSANGKGRERHASGEPFEQQKICEITRRVGLGYPLGQAIKKAIESQRLGARGLAELLGAIVYLAAAHIVMREQEEDGRVEVGVWSGKIEAGSMELEA